CDAYRNAHPVGTVGQPQGRGPARRQCSGARMRLAGKTALITGAGAGIGRAAAELFAAEGATVWATDRDAITVDGCKTARLDVLDPAQIEAVFAKAGPLDVLFNCAGMVAAGTILDCAEADWSRSFDLNVTAMYRTIRAAL